MSDLSVLFVLGAIALLGSVLRYLLPDVDIADLRKKLNRLVLAVLLPALIFKVIYRADVDAAFWQVPALAFCGLLVTATIGSVAYQLLPLDRRARGALVLAGAFGNVTYLGMPFLQGVFPAAVTQVTTVAILYEMTITPVNLVFGAMLASRYGGSAPAPILSTLREVATLPLLWAVVAALAFNLMEIPVPAFVMSAAGQLGNAVAPLMILSLGMALRIESLRARRHQLDLLIPCVLIKLALSPLVVWVGSRFLGMAEPFAAATVLEAAMPTQLVVLAVADRFGLDTELVALAALITTTASFVTLFVTCRLLVG